MRTGPQSFVEMVAVREGVYDLRITFADGEKFYYFLQVDRPKKQRFEALLRQLPAGLDLREYGKVLKSGKGTPPAALIDEMKKKYNLHYTE